MGLIRSMVGLGSGRTEERATLPAGFESLYWGRPTSSGIVLDNHAALRSAAVAACRRVIVSSILAMPAKSYTAGPNGRLVEQSSQRRVVANPSDGLSQRAWLAQMANSLVLDGNMYGLVTEWTTSNHPLQVQPVSSRALSWQTDPNTGAPAARYNGRLERIYPMGNLVVGQATPFLLPGDLLAQSPVELAMESIGAGLAAEKFGGQFFGDGAHPSSIIKSSDPALTQDQAQNIKDSVMASWQGRQPAVLGTGLEFEQVDVKDDATFIELQRWTVEQACRFFGVPPSMVYGAVSGQAVTYANVGQDDQQLLKHSLRSWVDDIEDCWSSLLPGPQQVQLKPEGLLRMSAKERHELYSTRLADGTMTVAEVRDLEDEDPLPVAPVETETNE